MYVSSLSLSSFFEEFEERYRQNEKIWEYRRRPNKFGACSWKSRREREAGKDIFASFISKTGKEDLVVVSSA